MQKQKQMIGNTYKEKLWIPGNQRRNILIYNMSKNIEITDKLSFIKKDYEIKTELTNIRLLYVNDERNYITGNLDVKMILKYGNIYRTLKNVKVYLNRNGQNIGSYTNIVKDSNYYFDMIINSVQNGEYTMFVEVEDNSGKKYSINLDFRNIQNKIINENGVNRTLRLTDDKIYLEPKLDDLVDFKQGIYGQSGLKVKGDSRGQDLRYYKFGNGKNVFYATFAVHGFEDLWNHDGKELTYIAERFKDYLIRLGRSDIFKDWTLYVFPQVNPDGANHGWTHDGPGRTTLYSNSKGNRGIDLNRNFRIAGTNHVRYTSDRNYNGENGFEAYEAKFLADFLKATQSKNGKNVLVDTHRMAWRNYRR